MENTTYTLGRVGMRIRGEFDIAAEYEQLDVVSYSGSGYVAKEAVEGVLPTDSTKWTQICHIT